MRCYKVTSIAVVVVQDDSGTGKARSSMQVKVDDGRCASSVDVVCAINNTQGRWAGCALLITSQGFRASLWCFAAASFESDRSDAPSGHAVWVPDSSTDLLSPLTL